MNTECTFFSLLHVSPWMWRPIVVNYQVNYFLFQIVGMGNRNMHPFHWVLKRVICIVLYRIKGSSPVWNHGRWESDIDRLNWWKCCCLSYAIWATNCRSFISMTGRAHGGCITKYSNTTASSSLLLSLIMLEISSPVDRDWAWTYVLHLYGTLHMNNGHVDNKPNFTHNCLVQIVYYPCGLAPNLLLPLKCQRVPLLLNRYAVKMTWLHVTQAFDFKEFQCWNPGLTAGHMSQWALV